MKKFKDAFNGLIISFKDKAIITQCILGVLAIIGGIIIRLDYYEWLIYILCIVLVISFEIMNSVIEKLCDYTCDKYDEKIKVIKDLSASAVLVCSIGAFIICLLSVIKRIGD